MSQPIKSNQSSYSPAAQAEDLEALLSKCGVVLTREITNLLMESGRGKLSKQSSTDLVAYYRLLSELRAAQLEELGALSDAELAERSKAF